MRVLVDAGSTKTTWAIMGGNSREIVTTGGLNPSIMGLDEFRREVEKVIGVNNVQEVQFYGAGCRGEIVPRVEGVFRELFPNAEHIVVGSDLLLAAKVLCGYKEGIAAILGTGSNSCLYDGFKIVQNTPALGYILGDEGSGAVRGRKFVHAGVKGRSVLPPASCPLPSASEIIRLVYREPGGNRYLASLCPLIKSNLSTPGVRALVIDNFREFFRFNITPYNRPDLPVNCLGSVAYHFQDELREAARLEGYKIGKIQQHAIE